MGAERSRAQGMKWKIGTVKRNAEVGMDSQKLDYLIGEMDKVRKVVCDFGESQVKQSGRYEEMLMRQYIQ